MTNLHNMTIFRIRVVCFLLALSGTAAGDPSSRTKFPLHGKVAPSQPVKKADPSYIYVNLGDLGGADGGSAQCDFSAQHRLADEVRAHAKTSLFQVEWSAEVLSMHSNTKYWYDRRTRRLTVIETWGSMDVHQQTLRKTYKNIGDRFVTEIRY